MVGDKEVTEDNRKGVMDKPGKKFIPSPRNARSIQGISPDAIPTEGEETATCLVGSPFPYEKIAEDSPQVAYKKVLADVGCSFSRDVYDKELIKHVKKGTAFGSETGIIDSPEDVGGWPLLKKGKGHVDTDSDGMPDYWEKKHGLNVNDASDSSGYSLNDNYTNIEMYLNDLI